MAKTPQKNAKHGHGGARPGAGRPALAPEGRTTICSLSVPEALIAELDRVAQAAGVSRSQAATEALRSYVRRHRR